MKPIARRSPLWMLLGSDNFLAAMVKATSTLLIVLLILFEVARHKTFVKENVLSRITSASAFGFKIELAEQSLNQLVGAPSKGNTPPLNGQERDQILTRLKLVGPVLVGRRVLWVDDRPEMQIKERRFLSSIGIAVDSAQSNQVAQNLMDMQRRNDAEYDLVISDVDRDYEPGQTGFKLADWIQLKEYASPVILYTTSKSDRPPNVFAMTPFTAKLFNYVFDVLETRGTSLPDVQATVAKYAR